MNKSWEEIQQISSLIGNKVSIKGSPEHKAFIERAKKAGMTEEQIKIAENYARSLSKKPT
jgi:hypothetical protein